MPSVAGNASGGFVVAWAGSSQAATRGGNPHGNIFAQRFDSEGEPVGSEFRVNTTTTGEQREPAVSLHDDGRFVVTWQDQEELDGSSNGVFGQRFDQEGEPLAVEFQVNVYTSSSQVAPSLSFTDAETVVVVWQGEEQDGSFSGVFGRLFDVLLPNPTETPTVTPSPEPAATATSTATPTETSTPSPTPPSTPALSGPAGPMALWVLLLAGFCFLDLLSARITTSWISAALRFASAPAARLEAGRFSACRVLVWSAVDPYVASRGVAAHQDLVPMTRSLPFTIRAGFSVRTGKEGNGMVGCGRGKVGSNAVESGVDTVQS